MSAQTAEAGLIKDQNERLLYKKPLINDMDFFVWGICVSIVCVILGVLFLMFSSDRTFGIIFATVLFFIAACFTALQLYESYGNWSYNRVITRQLQV